MATLQILLHQSLFCIVPLLVISIAGLCSEKGGVLNFALEGLVMIGAFTGILFLHMVQASGVETGQGYLLIAMLIGGITGMALSLAHAFASINLGANQVISAFAINLFVPALTVVLARAIVGVLQIDFKNTWRIGEIPGLAKIPFIGPVFFSQTFITTYIGIGIFVAVTIILKKTKFGMRLEACGEHPQAADSVGISVTKIRYIGVALSGFLCGIGGIIYIIPNATEYSSNIGGYGYLAYAILIFGLWRSKRILFGAILFGLAKTLANVYTSIPLLLSSGINSYFYKMIPYVVTIIVLMFISRVKYGEPSDLGNSYDKSVR